MTLKELLLLFERHRQAQERQDYRSALICSVIANTHKGKNTQPYKPADFMAKKEKKTAEQMFETVKALNKLYAGSGGE